MINNALKVVRQYHHMSQIQLAKNLSISNSYLSELEAGKKEPTLELLHKYAAEFNVPLSSLVVFSETLDGTQSKSKARAFISKKMLKILEWISDVDEKNINEA
ncbi:helix-turn-helix transcriptional regulator [Glaciimonas sp. CA11.2]|uniref:helix-turn-helix transcriptional regulator n=1 Tax=Glaciimonas sp. CA11.2 TaxID=3048601 RepID=UPI002AB488EE|nr:helix-turn-helix transcriptional regulator [Glaciimonas sp. CA11.2]MDY7545502.1 helix-turn-helix transcriptional regulator [Glaciimonas sp. CA11.2]